MACPAWMYGTILQAQSEQVVEVTSKNFRFVTKQGPLRLGLPTVIKVRNEDAERHDFGSWGLMVVAACLMYYLLFGSVAESVFRRSSYPV